MKEPPCLLSTLNNPRKHPSEIASAELSSVFTLSLKTLIAGLDFQELLALQSLALIDLGERAHNDDQFKTHRLRGQFWLNVFVPFI